MPVRDLQDAKDVDAALERAVTAKSIDGVQSAIRTVFVELLDFAPAASTIPLHSAELPVQAYRLAAREGVSVVALHLDRSGPPRAKELSAALKALRETLTGDVLLATIDAEGTRVDLIYPAQRDGRETLRRMVVRRGEPRRTVAQQLAGVFRDTERGKDMRSALDRAYDVEAVTKRFFAEYKRVFGEVEAMVEGLPDPEDRRLFCQTLFNRLMFLEFLQRKGWLTYDGDPDYLEALWRARPRDANFYDGRLTLLFFTALNNPQHRDFDVSDNAGSLIGRVPFLNGGLFDRTSLDEQEVIVPDRAIDAILHDLFDKFNFTVAESTPYDVEVAVDPEMLGKVFEELVTGRHETGSYYTPRPIVSFMCREGLKGYLDSALSKDGDDRARVARVVAAFVDDHDVSGLTVQDARAVLSALEVVTVLDPACGSGAYLLGMLHELVELQSLLYSERLLADAKSLYELKLRVIERNLYGADIDPFAVNVAMLRLWLSLAIEHQGSSVPPSLPNLDFKIVQGDSLSAPNPSPVLQSDMFRTLAHADASELARLKGEHLRAVGEDKRTIGVQIAGKQTELTDMLAADPAPAGAVDWRIRFAEVFDQRGGFDIVVANPPYVRQELIRAQKPRLGQVYGPFYSGVADLYVYFYYRALEMLRDGGMLTFISSNKWLHAAYGEKLRQSLGGRTDLRMLIDCNYTPTPTWPYLGAPASSSEAWCRHV